MKSLDFTMEQVEQLHFDNRVQIYGLTTKILNNTPT